jgi:hypothetical protein
MIAQAYLRHLRKIASNLNRPLHGTDEEILVLIADALAIIQPDDERMVEDAANLEVILRYTAEELSA